MSNPTNKLQAKAPAPIGESTKPRGRELSTEELAQVTGGKIKLSDILITSREVKASD